VARVTRLGDDRITLEEALRERDAYASALAEGNSLINQKVKEFSIIKRVGEATLGNPDQRRVVTEIVDVIIDETSTENTSIWLVDERRDRLILKAARGQEDEVCRYFDDETAAPSIAIGEGAAGWVAKNGESLLIEDTAKSDHFVKKESSSAVSATIKSLLVLPLKGAEGILGVVNLSHPDIGAFSKEHERVLSLIMNQAYLALTNCRLFARIKRFSEELEETVRARTRELAYSESRYRAFLERAGDAIVVMEAEGGVIVEVNSRACEFTGRKKDELLGAGPELLFDPEAARTLEERLVAGSGFVEGLPLRLAGEPERYVEASVATISTDSVDARHMILRDITARHKLEAQLKKYSEGLNELVQRRTEELKIAQDELLHASKMAVVGQIASGVAHEINNPLAVISGYAESLTGRMAAGQAPEPGEVANVLRIISAQADRCQEITQSVLNFARRQAMSIELVEISKVVAMASELAFHKGRGREVVIVTDIAPGLPPVITDPHMIEQILLNLISNAVDAVGAEGRVVVSARTDAGSVVVSVADNGPGIPSETQKKIFTPFFTTKPMGEGTGLGLAICRQLAERLHAQLAVTSAPSRGATFTLTLPTDIAAEDFVNDNHE
jgi:two-component system NtrC family sensor kinase